MKTLKILILGALAFASTAFVPSAQAHDRHYRHRHSHGRVIVYTTPRHYYYNGYRDYPRYRTYHSGPSISIGFGGHSRYHHHRHYR